MSEKASLETLTKSARKIVSNNGCDAVDCVECPIDGRNGGKDNCSVKILESRLFLAKHSKVAKKAKPVKPKCLREVDGVSIEGVEEEILNLVKERDALNVKLKSKRQNLATMKRQFSEYMKELG